MKKYFNYGIILMFLMIISFVVVQCNSSTRDNRFKPVSEELEEISDQVGSSSPKSSEMASTTKVKQTSNKYQFKVGDEYVVPIKSNEPINFVDLERLERTLLDSIKHARMALVFRGWRDGKQVYLSKNKESAILVNKSKIEIINSEKGIIYEGDASQFYEYDDTFSNFYLMNNGQSFIFYRYGEILFYKIENGLLEFVDKIDIPLKFRANCYIDLSYDNKKLYMITYDSVVKATLIKIIDPSTRSILLEKEIQSPFLFSSLSSSVSDRIFTSSIDKKILIFNEILEYVKAIELKNPQRLNTVKYLEKDEIGKVAIVDDSRLLISDLNTDILSEIKAPEGFYFSDICFYKENSILFSAHRFNQDSIANVDWKIEESILVESDLNNLTKMKYYETEKGFYRFEKINDDIFIRVMKPNIDNDMGRLLKIKN